MITKFTCVSYSAFGKVEKKRAEIGQRKEGVRK